MRGAQDARNGGIIDVVGIPQPQLPHGRIQAQFEHVADLVGQVGLGAVPHAVMDHHHGTGLADYRQLSPKVVVAGDIRFADAAVMAARQDHGAAHLPWGVV